MLMQIFMLQYFIFHFCEPRIRCVKKLVSCYILTEKTKICSAVLFYTENAGIFSYSRNRASDLLLFLFWYLL
jgi:hypothetical protein